MSVTSRKNGCSNYSIEERIEAVRRRMYQETSFADTLAIYDISRATLSNWIKRFKGEVIRRESGKGIPLYVRKYQEMMTPEEEKELERLRR